MNVGRPASVQGTTRRDAVELVHCDAYADRMASGGAFDSREAFMASFDAYTSREGFDLVIGYLHGEPIGQSWGWALTPNSAWWRGLLAEPVRNGGRDGELVIRASACPSTPIEILRD